MKLFKEIKGKVHDSSGIENPQDYYWDNDATTSGVYYPIKPIENDEIIEEIVTDVLFETWDSAGSTFCEKFKTFKDAKEKFDNRLDSEEECLFGLNIVSYNLYGERLQTISIYSGECIEKDGTIIEKLNNYIQI